MSLMSVLFCLVPNGGRMKKFSAVLVGILAAAMLVAPAAGASATVNMCKSGYYENSSGNCVHRPSSSPRGATAQCRDRTYSYSQHRSGTCSGHGGVYRWL